MFLAINKCFGFCLKNVIRFRMQCMYHFWYRGVLKYFFKGDELTRPRIIEHFI